MFAVLLLLRLYGDDDTIGPRDLSNCGKAARYWTSDGWRENEARLNECEKLRDQAHFEDRLVSGLGDHASEV